MKLVPLTQGEFAMVDDEDYALVMQHKWQCAKIKNSDRKYAIATVNVGGKETTLRMHRLIIAYHAAIVDHIDRNGLNNQKHNLRSATNGQNGQNRKVQAHSSQYKGVSWHKQAQCWRATIRVEKRLLSLGCFKTEVDAARAYNVAAAKYFGPFARSNTLTISA